MEKFSNFVLMTSLIYRKDFENPLFRRNDSIVNIQTHLQDNSAEILKKPPPLILETLNSPKMENCHRFTSLDVFRKNKRSLPDLIQTPSGFYSQRSSPRNRIIPIEDLYSKKQTHHFRANSDALPSLSCRNYENSRFVLDHPKGSGISQEKVFKKSPSLSKPKLKLVNKSSGIENKVLLEYLDFLEKSNGILVKDTVKKKFNKSISRSKSGRMIDISLVNESIAPTGTSMQSLKGLLSPKNSTTKSIGTPVIERSTTIKSNSGFMKKAVPLLSKKDSLDTSLIKEKMHLNRLVKMPSKLRMFRNNHEAFFKVLAQNLNEAYNYFMNEKKVQNLFETLTDKNSQILELIFPKNIKVITFDAFRLEQRFAMVEFVSEHLSIPAKLEKMRQGVILLEPSLVKELQAFNEKLEDFIILKKREHLQLIKDKLIQTEDNLQYLFQKKIEGIRKKNRVKEYEEAKAIISERPKIGYYHFTQENPIAMVENYQLEHGELKNVKYKNVEHARGLSEIFLEWRKHIEKNKV